MCFLSLFNGCVQNTAFLGPLYTLGSTGNIAQSGFSYASGKTVTSLTGKSPGENIKEILVPKKKDSEFKKLVKKQIEETRKKINLLNQ